jgi:hypothetical protein
MKSFATLLLGLLISASIARADVLVYKNKITGTDTGGGFKTRFTDVGYTIVNPEEADFPVMIIAFPDTKTFYVWEMADCTINGLSAPKANAKKTLADLWSDTNNFAGSDIGQLKGMNLNAVDVGTTNLWNIPKTFSWVGKSMFPLDTGEPNLEESSGTCTLDLTQTKLCNSFGDDLEAAIDRMKARLVSLGYTEQ